MFLYFYISSTPHFRCLEEGKFKLSLPHWNSLAEFWGNADERSDSLNSRTLFLHRLNDCELLEEDFSHCVGRRLTLFLFWLSKIFKMFAPCFPVICFNVVMQSHLLLPLLQESDVLFEDWTAPVRHMFVQVMYFVLLREVEIVMLFLDSGWVNTITYHVTRWESLHRVFLLGSIPPVT
jgi:hypothetical protein